jgi:DNA-binding response OmpR family regulator
MDFGALAGRLTGVATRSRVLIADPDESLLAAYRELLWEDFEVITAPSGVECMACLRDCTPDVLVLEPQLPRGGGDSVLAMMHEAPDLAIVPVMILTSCRDKQVLEGVAPYRISDYHVKPLAPRELATRIRTMLELRRLRQSATPENVKRTLGGRTIIEE